MRAIFKADDPQKISFTATFTMPLEEWMRLREMCSDAWPGWDFKRAITDMVAQAQKTFIPRTPDEDE